MAIGRTSPVSSFIHEIWTTQETLGLSDGDLLERFVANSDEAAFAALMKRHGRMVMGICRRILSDHQHAEDAFQATFFVFARRARSIRDRKRLGNWLHGVAFRTAMKARAQNGPRFRETLHDSIPDRDYSQNMIWRDLRPILDQEITRLPEKYRTPFILCHLEGRTNAEAARLLQRPEGSIVTHLARARARLRQRLTRRGLTLSAAALSTALSQNAAPAAMSAIGIKSTAQAAVLIAAGQSATGEAIFSQSLVLMEGVLKAMVASKLRTAMVLALVPLFMILGGGVATYRTLASGRAPDDAAGSGNVVTGKQESPKPLRITAFYEPVFEGGAIGQPVPVTFEISGLDKQYAAEVAALFAESLRKRSESLREASKKLSAEQKLDKILDRLQKLEEKMNKQGPSQ
jgi:RNA polymerase sigma factor (sigma-70 family)